VPIKQERFKAEFGISYTKAKEAYLARQEQRYGQATTKSLGDALMEPRKRDAWLIPGRIQAGSITTLIGTYGTGKTTAVEGMLARMVKGQEIEPGYPLPKPLRILYLQCELGEDQHKELLFDAGWAERIGQGTLNNITVRWGWTWNNRGYLFRLLEEAKEADNPYDLIVVDSVSGALGTMAVDENSLAFAQATYGTLLEIKNRIGTASLVIAHPNAEGSRHRGHSASPGMVDHIWWLEKISPEDFAKATRNLDMGFAGAVANANDYLQIRVEKHRGGFHTGPMLVRVCHEERSFTGFGAMYSSGVESEAKGVIEAFLAARDNGDAFSLAMLQRMGNYKSLDTARKSLRKLETLGVVAKAPANPEDKRTTYYRSARWGSELVSAYLDGEQVTKTTAPVKAANRPAKAPRKPAPSSVVTEGQVVPPEQVVPLDLNCLPAVKTPMAVLEEENGVWRNGFLFWKVKGIEVELGKRWSDGNYSPQWFPLEKVGIVDRTRAA
jgi:hypothetical protein